MSDTEPDERGSGGRNERAESGLSSIRDARLEAKAIRQGWIKGRWPTRLTEKELEREVESRGDGPTLIERLTLAAHKRAESDDERVSVQAIRAGVGMERQNQSDDHHAIRLGQDDSGHESTTRTPDQLTQAMDETVPLAHQTA